MGKKRKIATLENRKGGRGRKITVDDPLTEKEMAFVDTYMIEFNATEAARAAGYNGADNVLRGVASRLLSRPNIIMEIQRRNKSMRKKGIADSEEVMNYLTQVMRGEIKDQFGLDAPLSERTKAAQELAKRTVDIENRAAGKADNVLEIKFDWSRD